MFFENKKADPDHLKGSPSLLRLLFFHYPQHHSRTQLKAVLEDQAVCNCVIYYTCIIMTEVRVCTGLLLKSY